MNDPFSPEVKKARVQVLSDWRAITEAFDSLPSPKVQFTYDEGLSRTIWVFRGHKKSEYTLQPSIERKAEGKCEWRALELMVLREFQSKAKMHMDPADVPALDDDLSWLAVMQHHGIPTRLLDFTYSPYVALYFALRERTSCERSSPAEIWAIDANALMEVAVKISLHADRQQAERSGKKLGHKVRSGRADAATVRDVLQGEDEYWNKILPKTALAPDGHRREHFNDHGFVALALPPIQNRRLSSQQGVFLFSGAERLGFQESLFKMMNGQVGEWYKIYQVPAQTLPGVEQRLFQMNIHDLSLFPDIEGLAGFVHQKIQSLWFPNDENPEGEFS